MIIENKYDDGVFDLSNNSLKGFNPKYNPLKKLPQQFDILQDLMDNMPIWIDEKNKIPGYLNTEGLLAKKVLDLPNYLDQIKKLDKNHNEYIKIIQALYRAYTFLASAYLLEPSHHEFLKTGKYGKSNNNLPKNIAIPLVYVSETLNVAPFLDYHYSYSLGNYILLDPNGKIEYENLGMACKFSGTQDECGFIMLHVDIDSYSPSLLNSIRMTLNGIIKNDGNEVKNGLKENYETLIKMNERRSLMWKASNYKNYNNFRVFIMGIKGNEAIFGDGVIYEGVEKYEGKPQQFRGQTGAQDDIIPTSDIFSGVIKFYPENLLTKYLMEWREYRPKVVQNFFVDLESDCKDIFENIKKFGDDSLLYLLGIVEEIYKFRNGHWMFVQKYIMSNTKYPKATGGTPIISWLPNQIEACLMYMKQIMNIIKNKENEMYKRIEKNHIKYCKIIKNQLIELKKENYNVDLIYLMNEEFKEYIN